MTDDKIVSLYGEALPEPGKPVDVCVKELERLLEQAKSGEIVAISYVVLHGDEAVSWGRSSHVHGYKMIGASACATDDLIRIARRD